MTLDRECSQIAGNLAHLNNRQVVTIDVLPDDILLSIFDFHVFKHQGLDPVMEARKTPLYGYDTDEKKEPWQSLVHVCRRWRGLVFGSPRRLNLRLRVNYVPGTPARKSLDVWPALPLFIQGFVSEAPVHVDNVIAELEHGDRIRQIILHFNYSVSQTETERLLNAMQFRVPELEILRLTSGDRSYAPVLHDQFLGGSAPRLRYLVLISLSFLGLPNLLMSATHLVDLHLCDIPHSGYISPKAVVNCLSMLTSLEILQLYFQSPQSSPDQENRPSPPSTRSILPALKEFWFKGVNEYLEELVTRIDTPRLEKSSAIFFHDVDFDTPELIQFLCRSSTFKSPNEAHLFFERQSASVKLLPQASNAEYFSVGISCREPDWQLSSLAQICTAFFQLLSTTENLLIYEPADVQLDWNDGIENVEWLEFLLSFIAVKNLYLSEQFAPRLAPTLQEISEGGATEVLSTLQNLYLEGFDPSEPVQEGIGQFISLRQLTNHPVAISVWEKGMTWDRLEGHFNSKTDS